MHNPLLHLGADAPHVTHDEPVESMDREPLSVISRSVGRFRLQPQAKTRRIGLKKHVVALLGISVADHGQHRRLYQHLFAITGRLHSPASSLGAVPSLYSIPWIPHCSVRKSLPRGRQS